MKVNENFKYCHNCTNRKIDYKEGIICGLTRQKPDFEDECKDFNFDKMPTR
jgi:hypothetical protein